MPRLPHKIISIGNHFSYKSLFIILFFLLIGIVALFKFNPKDKVSAAWWNDGWGYRVAVNIGNTSGSTLTDYQVAVSIGTSALINSGKMQSDCDDIRITDVNGNLLTYWLSSCNTSATQVWPKIATIPNGGVTIYVYYGNPSATAGKTIVGGSNYPGLSCKSILDAGNSTGNGNYWIDPTNGNTSDKFQAYCDMTNDSGGWMLVKPSMIGSTINSQTTSTQTTDNNGGLIYTTTVGNPGDCSGHYGKFYLTDIIPWSQIKADYTFLGGNSCWAIFGNTNYNADTNLIPFSSGTDTIRNQVKMGGSNGDIFDGTTNRCDNTTTNFWHGNQGVGTTRSAQIILRRNSMAAASGLGTGVACSSSGYPWIYQNIYLRETVMTFAATASSPSAEEQSTAPIAYWKFDEGVGTSAYDSSSIKANANLNGGNKNPVWASEDQCISGKCLSYDATDYQSVVTNTDITKGWSSNNDFTLSLWFNCKGEGISVGSTQNDYLAGLFIHGSSAENGNGGFYLRQNSVSCVNVQFDVGASGGSGAQKNIVGNLTTPNSNVWHNIVATKNGDTLSLYDNANLIKTQTFSGTTWNVAVNQETRIGSVHGRSIKGLIDDVKVYPYSRTVAQIKSDYASGKAHSSSTKGTSANLGSNNQNLSALNDGLVGYWKMEEGIGTTSIDSSGNNNTATLGTGNSAPTWSPGKYGVGLSFDGVNDYAVLTNKYTFSNNSFTIGYWLYLTSDSGRGGFFQRNASSPFNGVALGKGSPNVIDCSIWDTSANIISANVNQRLNQWVKYDCTFNPSTKTVILYENGIQVSSNTNTSFTNVLDESSQYIPQLMKRDTGDYMYGSIDEVRIYNRALSPNEIQQLYMWAPGPVAYYKFDEGSGNSINNIGSIGDTGTWSGTGTHWTQGKFGSAGNFNGSNDYINVAESSSLNIPNDITVSFWAKLTKPGTARTPLGKYPNSDSGWEFVLNTDGTISFAGRDKSTNYRSTGYSTSDITSTWHHITGQRQGSVWKLYIDGILNKSLDVTTTGDISGSGKSLEIGRAENSNSLAVNGQIDEVKIFNYVRSQRQIIEDMNGGHPIGGSPVGSQIAYWKFDEGYGSATYDSSFHNNTGTFGAGSSAPTWTNNGKFGKALSFADGQYIRGLSDILLGLSQITISAWVKPISTTYIFQHGSSYSINGYINFFRVNSTGSMTIDIEDSVAIAHFTPSTPTGTVSMNVWNYVSVVIRSNLVDFYVNGKKVYTSSTFNGAYPFASTSDGYKNIGRYNYNNTSPVYSSATIDEVKIYNSALNDNDILLDYNQGKSMVMGSKGTESDGITNSFSAAREYCIPGDTSTCNPPVAEWKMDEGVGTTAYDTSGNNLPGVLGTGNSSPTWVQGKIGSGLSYSGNDYVLVTDNSLLKPTSAITVESWFNTSDKTANQRIVSKTEGSGYQLSLNENSACTSNTLCFLINIGSTYYQASYPVSNLSNNTWYHATGSYDGSTVRLYLNGIGVGSTSMVSGAITQGNYPLCIGAESTASNCISPYLIGKIDNVKIYDYARTPAQISWDYNRGKPIAWWKFDECQGTAIGDWSMNGNTGTLNIGTSGSQNSIGTCSVGTSAAWTNGSSGKLNSSMSLDGTDDNVLIGDPVSGLLDFGTSDFSLSTWFKLSSLPNNWTGIIHKGSAGTTGYAMDIDPSNRITASIQGISGNNQHFYGNTLSPGVWYQATIVFKRNTDIKIYLNSSLSSSGPYNPGNDTSSVDTAYPLYLGASGASTWRFPGQIDDVRIFNYALTSTQVKDLYNNGSVNFSN